MFTAKRNILFFIFSFIVLCGSAQIQQGFVKVPTRRNADGSWRKGEYVQGATVGIQFVNKSEQSYVSGNDGHFSFSVSSPQFFVSSVTAKKGTFTFADADFSKKQWSYSKNPIEVLVDDPDVLVKAREEGISKERTKLRKQIRAQEDEIEELKATNKITTEEYNRMLDQLDQYRKSSEEIVRQIAEVYVTTDYDNLSPFNSQLLQYIEDGDYHRVDSLLKTKGNREDIYADIMRRKEAIRETRENLEKAEAYDAMDTKDFVQRLYYEHLSFMQQPMMQDSALYCLKMRADLDTTNVKAAWDYATLCYNQKKLEDCEKYSLICLRAYLASNDFSKIAGSQNNLGILYNDLHDYSNSEKYLKLSLENYEQLSNQNSDAYRVDLAMTQNNLGILYKGLNDYATSEKYYKLALENKEHLFNQNPDAYRADLAGTQNNLGNLYSNLHDYATSEKYHKLALENYEQLFKLNPDAYREGLANTQNNLGILYDDIRDYVNSEKYYKLALENKEQLFYQNPDANRADLAKTQHNLGKLYYALPDYANGKKYLRMALENYEQLFKLNPEAFRLHLAQTQCGMGIGCFLTDDYTNSEMFCKLAMANIEYLFSQKPNAYRADLANTQYVLGSLYSALSDYVRSEQHLKLALENYKQLFCQYPEVHREKLAAIYNQLLYVVERTNNIEDYNCYLDRTLELYTVMYNSNPDRFIGNIIELQNRKSWQLLANDKLNEAMSLAERTYVMKESHGQTRECLAECYNRMAYESANMHDFVGAHRYIDKAISLVPSFAVFYDSKGEIFLMQGRDNEALEMWKKVLKLNPNFLDIYPDGTNLTNGLKKLGLIE